MSASAISNFHLTEGQWNKLIGEIKSGNCTPFLGAGACYGVFPLGKEIANEWAKECEYPIEEEYNDLAKVAQYYSLHIGINKHPQQLLKDRLKKCKEKAQAEVISKLPHNFLSKLPISIYMTTNYDNEMYDALKKANKHPVYKVCEWNKNLKASSKLEALPSVECPLIYHLHGHIDNIDSMVLSENDYLDFLANTTIKSLPPPIHGALSKNTLLFIGYSLTDITFRTLYRGIINQFKLNQQFNIAVQLEKRDENKRRYLEVLFKNFNNIQIFWGSAEKFIEELERRWNPPTIK